MSRLSSKHRAVGVKPELYPTLGKYLVEAIKQVLGSKNTPEVVAAWNALYADQGFVPFSVVKKDTIACGPTFLLTLQRQDGEYYTLLRSFNGQNYPVAFKLGKNTDQNIVVNNEIANNRQVGSTVLVSAPAGSFGIISLMPMINELTQKNKGASVPVIQCVRTPDYAVFSDQFQLLPPGQYLFLTEKEPISKNHLEGKVTSDTHVYTSGSEIFIAYMVQNALAQFNLLKSQIHLKSIEPTLGLLKSIA